MTIFLTRLGMTILTGAYFNTTLAYDDAGNVLSSSDPLGHGHACRSGDQSDR